jgi:hypothetical protein
LAKVEGSIDIVDQRNTSPSINPGYLLFGLPI